MFSLESTSYCSGKILMRIDILNVRLEAHNFLTSWNIHIGAVLSAVQALR